MCTLPVMRLKVKFCRTFFEMTSLKFLGQAQRMRSGTKNIVGNSAGDNLTRVQLMKERKILRDKIYHPYYAIVPVSSTKKDMYKCNCCAHFQAAIMIGL